MCFSILLIRRYEKDRRSRFNALLDKLAALLPNFAECNTSDQKWTKAQIVDNAIKYIKNFQNSKSVNVNTGNDSPESVKILKILKKQNKKLREVLRNEFAPDMTEKDFCHLDFNALDKLIKDKHQRSSENQSKENDKNAPNDAGDVFVVSTEARNGDSDHTYSVIVHQEAEIEIGEEVPEAADDVVVLESAVEPSNEDQNVEESQEEVPTAVATTNSVQPIIIQMAAPQNVIQQPSFFHPSTIATVIPFQTASIRPLGAPFGTVMPPNKLPLPRNASASTG